MPTAPPITAIDHVVVMVDALADAAALWRRLGFTVSPRGQHSAVMGTANHTIMFGQDYLELLVAETPTDANADWRRMTAAGGEGLYGVALATGSADATQAAFVANGIAAKPVIFFERPVDRPGQAPIPAQFRVTSTPAGTISGLKLFVCQHLTREAVWLPELVSHANTVTALTALEMDVPDAAAARGQWRAALGEAALRDDGAVAVGRHLVRLNEAPGKPERVTALHLAVADIAATRAALGAGGVTTTPAGSGLRVAQVNGVDLIFNP